MVQNKPQAEKDPEVAIASAIGRVEAFIMRNSRSLLTALGVVIIVVGGFFGYKYLVAVPRMEKASAMMFAAEQQFAQDSFKLALNGDGNFAGFLQVIEKYGSTGTGNVARHYAGICYLRLGQYQEALDYLTQYKGSTDDVPSALLAAQNYGLRGDVYVQMGDYAEAAKSYEKAVATSSDPLTAPYYLKKPAKCTKSSATMPRRSRRTRRSRSIIRPAWRPAIFRNTSGEFSSSNRLRNP